MKNRTANFREIQILSDAEASLAAALESKRGASPVPKDRLPRHRYRLKSTAAEGSLTASANSTFTPGEWPIVAGKLARMRE